MPATKLIYLSLGSNLGDRAANIARALAALNAAGIRVTRQSSLYATEPVGFRTQPWFLNAAAEAQTSLLPLQLLHVLAEIQRSLGRRPRYDNGPRTLDIDILFYGAALIRLPQLEIPHPRLAARRFVLAPLAEIAPALRHPALGATIAELLAACPDTSHVHRLQT